MDFYIEQMQRWSGDVPKQVITEGFPVGDDNLRQFETYHSRVKKMLQGTANYFEHLKQRVDQGDMGAIKEAENAELMIRKVLAQLANF